MKHRNLAHMIRLCAVFLASLVLASCATKPPVQAMAEARAAVQSVRTLYVDDVSKKSIAYRYYQSAEKALIEAAKALDEKNYAEAKHEAHEATRQARLAAKLK
jgi:outer membrane PBP1 activator LpoA protein